MASTTFATHCTACGEPIDTKLREEGWCLCEEHMDVLSAEWRRAFERAKTVIRELEESARLIDEQTARALADYMRAR